MEIPDTPIKNIFSEINLMELLSGIVYVVVILLLLVVLRNYVAKQIRKRISDIKQVREYRIYLDYTVTFLFIILVFPVFLPKLKDFVAFISIFGAGIVLVFKEVFLNFFGFFYIVLRKPFKIGDKIKIGEYYGDVLDIRLMDFTILQYYYPAEGGQSTGRIASIPNSFTFLYPLINFSKEFSFNWIEIAVPVQYHTDWKEAEKISLQILTKIIHSLLDEPTRLLLEKNGEITRLTPRSYIEVKNKNTVIYLRFFCEPKLERTVKDRFWREFLNHIEKNKDITLGDYQHTYRF